MKEVRGQGVLPGMEDTVGDSSEEQLRGVVERVIFASDNGRYAVFSLQPEGQRGHVTVTVSSEPPLVGQALQLRGEWVVHPRYGRQFKAEGMRIEAPTDAAGIERFLGSGVIDGIGPAMAHRIVEKFGEDTLRVIEEHPKRLLEVAGIGEKTAQKIRASYSEQSELREVMLWLESHGVSGALGARICKQYGSFAISMLENHPYQLAQEVSGIGFATADTIAASLGIGKDDAARISAGIGYALQQIAMNGHVCVPESWLVERSARILQADHDRVREVMRRDLKAEKLLAEYVGGEQLFYPPYLYFAEKKTAEKLLYLQRYADFWGVKHPGQLVDTWEKRQRVQLSDGQKAALEGILQEGVFVLTGGPGTGKTTVVRGMIDLLEAHGLVIQLGAPTGRAAKRLAEATGRKALTVHRMLEAQGSPDGSLVFGKNADEQLEADVIILDEVSMMDIVLMQHFLEAVPDGCHVILVGDVDQLPAVGPGSVLKDILRSGVIPSVRLSEVFRQDGDSTIVLNAHAINAGRMPVCRMDGDFQFIEEEDADAAAARIVSLCAEELPRKGWSPFSDVQVLSPMHRLACGVDNLNVLLQKHLNPPSEEKPEFSSSTRVFRLGDKVMQTRNNYQKKVFNGDIGFITRVEPTNLTVKYSEELSVKYEKGELLELTLAYAMSVHKSQGSEYPVIILPLLSGHRIMLQRNLLYTAVTRAKKQVILIGSHKALQTAVLNDRTRKRYTLLAERLNREW